MTENEPEPKPEARVEFLMLEKKKHKKLTKTKWMSISRPLNFQTLKFSSPKNF